MLMRCKHALGYRRKGKLGEAPVGRALMEIERKLLRLLHGQKTRNRLTQIHAHFLRHGLHQSNLLLARFVSICGSLNLMSYSYRIFHQQQNPNILLFNAIIKGYSLNGPFLQSFSFFSFMKTRGVWPDDFTFAPLLKSCSCISDSRLGKCVHGEVVKTGFHHFGSIRIGIVELYAKGGMMMDASNVFDEMRERDVIVWNLMIRGFCDTGDVDTGLRLFRQMSDRSVVSWNSMISSLSQSGRDDEALGLFHEMKEHGFEPNEATIVSVLPICVRRGASDVGQRIHSYVESNGLFDDFISVGNALVDFYCKCGNLETAMRLFNVMPWKNVISWNVIISGLALNGKGRLGIDLFEEMIKDGVISPNEATFVGVIACCTHAGWVEKGRELFASMIERHQIEPRHEHYGVMVDLLARSGRVREAYDLVESMATKPNAALWGALLSACRTHGDVELAEIAAKELMRLEPRNSGNYVLLSNIYAEEGKWEEVERVRVLMRESSVKKYVGQSAIGCFCLALKKHSTDKRG